MPQARQKRSQEKRLISPAFSAFLQNRIKEIIGIFLFFCGFLFFLALFSYSPTDSAANIASYGASKNLLGLVGAYFADGFLQWFGLASYFIGVAFFVYGFHFLRNISLKGFLRLRPFFLFPSLLGLSAICAWLTSSSPHSEPFVNKGYGGAMGDILVGFLTGQSTLFSGLMVLVIFIPVVIVTAILSTYALILPFAIWQYQWAYIQKIFAFLVTPHKKEVYEEDEEYKEEYNEPKPAIIISKNAPQEEPQKNIRGEEKSPLWNGLKKSWPIVKNKNKPKDRGEEKESDLFESKVAASPPSSPRIYTSPLENKPYEAVEDSLEITPASQYEDNFDDEEGDDDFAFDSASPMAQAAVKAASPAPLVSAVKPAPAPTQKPMPKQESTKGETNNMSIKPNPRYKFPTLQMLDQAPPKADQDPEQVKKLEENAKRLEQTLQEFGVKGQIVSVRPGPVVTLYELEPAPGTRTSRVVGLSDDIARQMLVASVRVAPVAGKNVIGIEMPNEKRETVWLRTLFEHESFRHAKGKLAMALGENIGGEPMVVDLAKMPHLLIAGTTGSGKSVAVNTMILSLLYRLKPEECRLIMIDPKMLELSVYEDIPHLLTPVVTDPMKAVVSLKWAVREMDNRYRKMAKMGVRNIAGYNSRIKEALAKGETLTKDIQTGFDEQGRPITESVALDMDTMPYIVILIDEVADLMMMGGKQDIEIAVQRLAQKARAAGLHVIMATQRPSVDVITGTIKANFPTRISFAVTSRIDSRTILGEQGAEQLLGMGDMLYMAGGGKTERAHGPFVSDEEVEEIANHIRSQGRPQYVSAVLEDVNEDGSPIEAGGGDGGGEKDVLYDQALAIILKEKKASTSFIQRQLAIGYNRAARIIDQLEADGIISPADRVGRRTVLAEDHTHMDME